MLEADSLAWFEHLHCLIIPVVDDSSFFSLFALFLEFEILLKDRGEAVALEHAGLVHDGILVCREVFQVIEQGDIVTWGEADTDLNRLCRALMKTESTSRKRHLQPHLCLSPPSSPRASASHPSAARSRA